MVCSLELMKDDNGYDLLVHFTIWGGLITLTSALTLVHSTIRLLLFSIQVMALTGHVITS